VKADTTPQRVAGANVLTHLRGRDAVPEGRGEGAAPAAALPVAAGPAASMEVATSIGMVQHDYLLQNFVHATPSDVAPASAAQRPGLHLRGRGGVRPGPRRPRRSPLPARPIQDADAPKVSRKENSLGVLCKNFMDLFQDAPPNCDNNGTIIDICHVAGHLGVKRRRIYDVINILESIDIMCWVKKNLYR